MCYNTLMSSRVEIRFPEGDVLELSRSGAFYISDGGQSCLWYMELRQAEALFERCLRTVRVLLEVHDPYRPAGVSPVAPPQGGESAGFPDVALEQGELSPPAPLPQIFCSACPRRWDAEGCCCE